MLLPEPRCRLWYFPAGLTNRQIGEQMFLAKKIVRNDVSSMFACWA